MKILICGDQHFKLDLSYSSAISDGRRAEWESVKSKIHETAKGCDAVVLLGDNFNSRNNHSAVLKEFVEFLKGFGSKEIHILCGNHERGGMTTALDFLDKMTDPEWGYRNWHVYLTPTPTKVAGQEALMIPFMTPFSLGVETKEEGVKSMVNKFPEGKIPLAFAHHAISGTFVLGQSTDLFNEIVLPKEKLEEHFDHVFAGHIHGKNQISPSILVTGNVFASEVGEHSKSIWVYEQDGENEGKTKEVLLPGRGIYKVIHEEDSYQEIPDNSIVKCYVTNKETDMEKVKEKLKRFDASIIIEQYPSERVKVHYEDGGLDLSVDSLLKLYSEVKGLNYEDIKEGFSLIK